MKSAAVLAENGLLSKAIPGFTPRDAQQKMADAIERAIETQSQLIIEAGTGTGKTFGYLIPIFLSRKKTIISTGTKNLQEQLFFSDIPVIKKIIEKELGYAPKVVVLKGRSNYLCLHRLERSNEEGRFVSKEQISELQQIIEWSVATKKGDISELETISEDSSIWSYATSTLDNCLNQDCDFYKDCFVANARQQAMNADVIIVNHHLFFADMAIQDSGFGELLPNTEIVIFDEAHHIPDIASYFFSTVFSSRQLLELSRDSETEALLIASDQRQIIEEAGHLQLSVQRLRASFGTELKAQTWPDKCPDNVAFMINETKDSLQRLEKVLKEAAVRSKALESCWKRAGALLESFNFVTQTNHIDAVHWYETHLQSFTIHITPLIVANYFEKYLQDKKRSWIFTSATLSVNNEFKLFAETLGLKHALQLILKSPFDYPNQAMLYAPRGMPDTQSEHFVEAVVDAAIPLIEILQGKTFLLFTSHRALEKAYNYLVNKIDLPILKQGTKPKHKLIEEFKTLGNAVLLGTSSFWYGVDVRGDALSCVVIDKLPFSSPDDPLLQAKVKMFRKQGLDPFSYYQLPQAVLTLKQGAGRLIRDVTDRGILVICDPRLVSARYGEIFIKSLPNMQRTRDNETANMFLKNIMLST